MDLIQDSYDAFCKLLETERRRGGSRVDTIRAQVRAQRVGYQRSEVVQVVATAGERHDIRVRWKVVELRVE